jgi:hypothetical protein
MRIHLAISPAMMLALAALLFAGPDHAQAQDKGQGVAKVPYEGSHFFRNLLFLKKLQPVTDLTTVPTLPPQETVVIVFGDSSGLEKVTQVLQLDQFVARGGALLVASDRHDKGLLINPLQVQVTGEPILQYQGVGYRGKSTCPIINVNERHPLFQGMSMGIATNRPCWVAQTTEPPRFQILGYFSNPLLGMDNFRPGLPHHQVFMVGPDPQTEPDARVLILGGHGVFMNGMVAQEDNDNYRFANNCVNWLTDNGKRKYVLFIEEGLPQTKLDVGLSHLPDLDIWKIMAVIDIVLRHSELLLHEMERDNWFDRGISQQMPFRQFLSYFLIGFTLFLMVRGVRRLFAARYQRERSLPLASRTLERISSDASVVVERQRAALHAANLHEPARLLVRHWLDTHAPSSSPAHSPPVVQGSGGNVRQWQQQVDELWKLAHAAKPFPVSRADLSSLYRQLQTLHLLWKKGRLRFAGAP